MFEAPRFEVQMFPVINNIRQGEYSSEKTEEI